MALKDLIKLDRLRIKAFSKEDREGPQIASFEAPVNIDAFSQYYAIQYQNTGGIGTSAQEANHSKNAPKELQFNLVLDNTCVFNSDLGVVLPKTESIVDRVNQFLSVCYEYKSGIHSPQFLKVEWGELRFSCKLKSADVKYSLFDKGGNPLRAEIDVIFVEDKPIAEERRAISRTSPDITHAHIIKAGDTLPLIAEKVYGSSAFYLQLAVANGINHFRELMVGTEIQLPPLDELEKF